MQEAESMRVNFEGMMHAAGVDIVLQGHLHEMENSHAVYVCTSSPPSSLSTCPLPACLFVGALNV